MASGLCGTGAGGALAAMLWAGGALAGSTGGLYDFTRTLAESHPFATPAPTSGYTPPAYRAGPAPATGPGFPSLTAPAPAAPRPPVQAQQPLAPIAPPPPTYGYTPPPVPRAGQPAQVLREPRGSPPASDDTLLGGGFFSQLYLAFSGGIALLEDYDDQLAGTVFQNELDSGYVASMALGRRFGRDLRGELALDFRQNAIESIRSGGVLFPGDGDVNTYALMLNAYYDLRYFTSLVPYVGVGVGAAFVSGDEVQFGGRRAPAKDGTEFAYQGIVGLAYEFSSFALTLDYRYFGTGDADVAYQNATAGLRYAF